MWPTPCASDAKNLYAVPHKSWGQVMLSTAILNEDAAMSGGSLNPQWVEWLMGFPAGWTDLGALATQ